MIEIKKSIAKNEKILLRLPDDLRTTLKIAATANSNTLTAEIVSRLNESVLLDEIADVKNRVEDIDKAAAQAMLPHAERIRRLAEEMKKQANRDISMIETAAEFRIKKMIEEVIEDAFTRHGKSAIEKQ